MNYRVNEMDQDPTMPARVNLGMPVLVEFREFRYLLGQTVRHKSNPKLVWAVRSRQMVENAAGVVRSYQLITVLADDGPVSGIQEHVAMFFEHELLDGDVSRDNYEEDEH